MLSTIKSHRLIRRISAIAVTGAVAVTMLATPVLANESDNFRFIEDNSWDYQVGFAQVPTAPAVSHSEILFLEDNSWDYQGTAVPAGPVYPTEQEIRFMEDNTWDYQGTARPAGPVYLSRQEILLIEQNSWDYTTPALHDERGVQNK